MREVRKEFKALILKGGGVQGLFLAEKRRKPGRWSKLIIWPDLHEGSCIRVLNVVHGFERRKRSALSRYFGYLVIIPGESIVVLLFLDREMGRGRSTLLG